MESSATRRYIWLFFGLLLAVMIIAYLANTVFSPRPAKPGLYDDQAGTAYVTVRDTEGNLVLQTGLPVTVNDEYISAEDIHYIIIKVDRGQAVARQKKETGTRSAPDSASYPAATLYYPDNSIVRTSGKRIAIYHTHNDESYFLTSRRSSEKPNGDILQVGETMTEALRRSGFVVTHRRDNHNPHDINAYNRSRRTALQLLKDDTPDAIFDLHRDAAPLSAYLTQINGVETSRVMIVIGRSNPNMNANLQFARQVKATADHLYPGFVRGIYMGRGNYNQDLYPRSLLFEMGTSQGSLTIANRASRLLSDVITAVIGQSK